MRPISVDGYALWSPGFNDVEAWRSGVPDPAVVKPACALVGSRLKRGSSRFANMLGEVVERSAAQAHLPVGEVPTFYGSSLGEIETMVTLLRMLYEEEGKLSPTRFKNSVHNAASGLVSIATQNTSFSTAIAGGDRSFETTLLEAWAFLEVEGGSAIVAVADDAPPPPLDALDEHGGLAVAFALRADGAGPKLAGFRTQRQDVARHASITAELRGNCASPGLELIDALICGREGPVALSPVGGPQTVADLVLGE